MIRIIGISGKKGSGKDLLASYLEKLGWTHESFARALKTQVRNEFDMNIGQTDGLLKEVIDLRYNTTPRGIMTKLGQFYRQFDGLWWVKKTFQRINSTPGNYSISDVRFKNEADYIREQGGIVVRLERSQELNIYKEISTDISEIDLDDYKHFALTLPADMNESPDDLRHFALLLTEYVQ